MAALRQVREENGSRTQADIPRREVAAQRAMPEGGDMEMKHTLNLTYDELVIIHDALCVNVSEIEQHWRFWRNKEPGYIKDREDCQALRDKIWKLLEELK